MSVTPGILDPRSGNWRERLDAIVETMREMSSQTDPQALVRHYSARMSRYIPRDRAISLSRRGHKQPELRVTRYSEWTEEINPWKDKDRHPHISGGIFAELIYGDEARIIDRLDVADDDPAAEYLAGQRSLMAIPLFDDGVALNMIIQTSEQPDAFDCERLPEFVWMSNLFGRATHNLVLREELQEAYDRVDLELKVIADIQRSLLPAALPRIPTMDLAVEYKTAHRAGGDYYDFFPLPGGRWGILIADVSGHGTPAAVMMAITHTIAHGTCELPECPAEFLRFLNERLVCRYTAGNGSFVTAFYGVYDPTTRSLAYSNAGHNPPRVRRCAGGPVFALDNARSLPLGIDAGVEYEHDVAHFVVDDQIIFYTDGITDAPNSRGERFGSTRLDKVLSECRPEASGVIGAVLEAVDRFADGTPADDDQTLLIAKIR
ncbi:MAG: PP2C family protein-serine/threonine phosphatase [Planctomycetes bacterium]|nr:PP2C family protein-serine/threonine phosphatase [Planctomycetota bacterium]